MGCRALRLATRLGAHRHQCNKQLMVYGLTGTFYVPVVLHLWFGFLEW